jgi:hypothetical protein
MVFHADGVTPVLGAQVALAGGFSTVADAQGRYTVNFVPLGSYAISASDPGNGDQGAGAVTLSTAGQTQTANIILNGLGKVTVTLLDGAGTPAPNDAVSLTGQTSFGGTFNGVTRIGWDISV